VAGAKWWGLDKPAKALLAPSPTLLAGAAVFLGNCPALRSRLTRGVHCDIELYSLGALPAD